MSSGKHIVLVMFALSGCATFGGGAKPDAPIVAEPAAENPSVMLLDKLAGGLIGQKLGPSLEKADRGPALEAEYKALEQTPAGQTVSWKSGSHGGEVVAAQPYRVGSQNCRQYAHTFTIGPAPQTAKGTACRSSDGSWTPLT